jgi:hypothetical protein
MEYAYQKKPYLQIEKLINLIKSPPGESRGEYINEAGQYADLVLGTSWRKINYPAASGRGIKKY